MSDPSTLTIGGVTELLQEEFPDLTLSKIRFLEARGLIHPTRSASGYRRFRESDIERLRFILRLQRDHFLPLKVIKSQLALWERGEVSSVAGHGEEKIAPPSDLYEETFGIHELARRTGLSIDHIRQLITHRLLVPSDEDGKQGFKASDIGLGRQCGVLMDHGLEPRHLRMIHHSVVRQVELLDGLTAALRRNRSPDSRRRAAEMLQQGAAAIQILTESLLLAEVGALLEED